MKQTVKSKLNSHYKVKANETSTKEVDENSRVIKAIANTYNFFDHDQDILRMGCASKSIKERGAKSNAPDKILHAMFHDLTRLAGKSILEQEMVLDGKEVLYVESRLSETLEGEDALIKYKEGIYNQHSVGFRYVQIDYVEKDDPNWSKFIETATNPEDVEAYGYGFDVKEINLHEWSTVAFGANKLSPYLGTKSENKVIQLQNVYQKLDALIKKANRFEVKDKKIFDLQYSQLKQMISEITYQKPLKKVTPETTQEPTEKNTSWDWADLKSKF